MAVTLREFDKLFMDKYRVVIAGVDEAGRGPLAGPVVAGACIIPSDHPIEGINDSKQLTSPKRAELYNLIVNDPSIQWAVGVIEPSVIDAINILEATKKAMIEAVDQLTPSPGLLLVDGLQLHHQYIPSNKIIKGDSQSLCIAAASIVAKETRDRIMLEIDSQWPEYGFAKHKGYGTAVHRAAIERYGPCPIHRKSFEPIKSYFQPSLFSN